MATTQMLRPGEGVQAVTDNAIEINGLVKAYGGFRALNGLDLTLPYGQVVGLLGENGCGKTTLLKVLAGVLQDYSGDVTIAGHRPGPESKARVSFLPDTSFLPDSARVSDCLRTYRDFFADFDDAKARAKLEATRAELQAARDDDAVLATRLAAEQAALEKARAEVAKARHEVEAQRALTAQAARDAYQGRSDVSGLIGVLESRSLGEVQQRLQWDTTIFGSTTARLTKLQALEAQLEDAERAQAAIEARVAADKKASADNVARVARLEASAAQQEGEIAALVERNAQFQAQAQQALAEDMDRYNQLVAQETAIEAELAQRVAEALSRGPGRDDLGRLVAAGTVWTDHATYPLVSSGAQVALSPQGFIRPVNAKNGSPFGRRFHPILHYWRNHNGTDFGAACATPLYAAQSGTVVTAGRQGGFGNYVVIDHGNIGGASIMTGYAHQSRIAVKVGQQVNMGQLIGYVGTTGLSTGCHLHLQVYVNGGVVNPMNWL